MNNTQTRTYNNPTPPAPVVQVKNTELAVLAVSPIAQQLYENQPGENKKFSAIQIEVMRNTIARGASYEELFLFMEQCLRTGLDPFMRQIYSIRRKQWNNQTRSYDEAQVIQVGIDGFRLIAQRTGQYAGQDGPFWCGPDARWREVWLEEEPPAAAKVVVYRHDHTHPISRIAIMKSYAQTNSHGEAISRWKTDPAGMLAKCAEALALRAAFPNDLSGLYTTEEMGQADNPQNLPAEHLKQLQQIQSQGQLPEGSFFIEPSAVPNAENSSMGFMLDLNAKPAKQPEAQNQKPAQEEQPGSPAVIEMTLDEAKHTPDSRGTLYGNIHPEQLTYRYNNMSGMLGKVDAEKEAEYRLKMRAIELIQADATKNGWKPMDSQAAEKNVLNELGFSDDKPAAGSKKKAATPTPPQPDGQPALMDLPADPYEDLKRTAAKLRDDERNGDYTAFWLLQQRTNWTREQALEIVKSNKGDAYAAFTDLLKRIEQPQAAAV